MENILVRNEKINIIFSLKVALVYERNETKMENYSFEQFWIDLRDGYQIYFDYMDVRYLIYKMQKNCYKKEMITELKKSPLPKNEIITLKRVKELFDFMSNFEYKAF